MTATMDGTEASTAAHDAASDLPLDIDAVPPERLDVLARTIDSDALERVILRVDGWRSEGHRTHAETLARELVTDRDEPSGNTDAAVQTIRTYLQGWVDDVRDRGVRLDADVQTARLIAGEA